MTPRQKYDPQASHPIIISIQSPSCLFVLLVLSEMLLVSDLLILQQPVELLVEVDFLFSDHLLLHLFLHQFRRLVQALEYLEQFQRGEVVLRCTLIVLQDLFVRNEVLPSGRDRGVFLFTILFVGLTLNCFEGGDLLLIDSVIH